MSALRSSFVGIVVEGAMPPMPEPLEPTAP